LKNKKMEPSMWVARRVLLERSTYNLDEVNGLLIEVMAAFRLAALMGAVPFVASPVVRDALLALRDEDDEWRAYVDARIDLNAQNALDDDEWERRYRATLDAYRAHAGYTAPGLFWRPPVNRRLIF